MLEVPYLPAPTQPDCSGRYVASGVILLVVAVVFGMFTALMPVSYVLQQRTSQASLHGSVQVAYASQPLPPGSKVISTSNVNGQNLVVYNPPPGVQGPSITSQQSQTQTAIPLLLAGAMYLCCTVACGWLGIASLLKRRYVRPLLLVFSTQGVILGVCTCIAMAATVPLIIGQLRGNSAFGTGPMIGMLVGLGVFCLFIVVPPVVLLLLMRPETVRFTAERHDLRPRWTDGLPIRVLGLVLTLLMIAASELLMLGRPRVPMFRTVFTGLPAIALILCHLAVMVWAAVRVYRRDDLGWRVGFWGVVVPSLVFLVSSMTLPQGAYAAAFQDQPGSAEIFNQHENLMRLIWAAFSVIFLIAYSIYMLRVRPLVSLPEASLTTASTQ